MCSNTKFDYNSIESLRNHKELLEKVVIFSLHLVIPALTTYGLVFIEPDADKDPIVSWLEILPL